MLQKAATASPEDSGCATPGFSTPDSRQRTSARLKDEIEAKKAQELMGEDDGPKHWLIDHVAFKTFITTLVIVNAIQMGFEVDHPEAKHIWKVFDHVFGAVFFIEMLMKLVVLRLNYFRDRWNWLDGSLAIMGFVDTWLITIIGGGNIGLQNFSILRILRLLRLMRLLRLFRQFSKLVIVMRSIMDAMVTTLWVASILLIIIYVCAIFCVDIIGQDNGTYEAYATDVATIDESETMANFNPYIVFGSMPVAMLSLFNIAILAEWTEIVRPIQQKQPAMLIFFVSFVIFVCFGVINVIIGMVVDSVMQNHQHLEEEISEAMRKEKLEDIMHLKDIVFRMDTDGDHTLDLEELHALFGNKEARDPQIREIMDQVELPYGCSEEELLDLLDKDGNGSLQHDEFLQSFYRLVGSGSFQQSCLAQMGINKLTRGQHQMESAIQRISQQIEQQSLQIAALCTGSQHQIGQINGNTSTAATSLDPAPSSSTPDLATSLDTICKEVTKAVHFNVRKELTQCFEKARFTGPEARHLALDEAMDAMGLRHVDQGKLTGQREVTADKAASAISGVEAALRYPFNAPITPGSEVDAVAAVTSKEEMPADSTSNDAVEASKVMSSSSPKKLPPLSQIRTDSSLSSQLPSSREVPQPSEEIC